MKRLSRHCGAALLVTSVAALVWQPSFADHKTSQQTKSKNAAIAVEVAHVKAQDIPLTVSSVGSVASYQEADLSTAIDGHVEKILFQNGQCVKKGDLVVQLDLAQVDANLQSAKAALHLSQLTLLRYLQLQKSGGSSQQIIDKAHADVATNLAAVKTAEAAVTQKKIYAPFAGCLGAFSVNVGDYVTAGQDVVKLVNNQHVRISYEVAQRFVSKLALKQKVDVVVDGLDEKVFEGQVSFVSPTVNKSTRTVDVEATLDNKSQQLKPGMFAHIAQRVGVAKNSLVVPEQSITASLSGDYVFKVVNGRAVSTPVTVGQRFTGFAQITKGVSVNDVIVTAGIQKLTDGSRVSITGTFGGKPDAKTLGKAAASGLGTIAYRVTPIKVPYAMPHKQPMAK